MRTLRRSAISFAAEFPHVRNMFHPYPKDDPVQLRYPQCECSSQSRDYISAIIARSGPTFGVRRVAIFSKYNIASFGRMLDSYIPDTCWS